MKDLKKVKSEYDKKRRKYLRKFFPKCLGGCGKRVSDPRHKRCKQCFGISITGKNHPFYGKLRPNFTGKNHPFFGKKRTEHSKIMKKISYWSKHKMSLETRSKMSLAKGGTGIPHENNKYPSEFSFKLRRSIRIRDNNKCQRCFITNKKHLKLFKKTLTIHHIDYNKFNNKENNLLSLCIKCNGNANSDRDYWFAYYTYLMENYIYG